MKCAPSPVLDKLGILALLGLMLFVSAARPLVRPMGHLYARFGLTRMSLLTEGADQDDDATATSATHDGDSGILQTLFVVAVLLLFLKRRATHRAAPVRRLKIPPHHTDNSLASH